MPIWGLSSLWGGGSKKKPDLPAQPVITRRAPGAARHAAAPDKPKTIIQINEVKDTLKCNRAFCAVVSASRAGDIDIVIDTLIGPSDNRAKKSNGDIRVPGIFIISAAKQQASEIPSDHIAKLEEPHKSRYKILFKMVKAISENSGLGAKVERSVHDCNTDRHKLIIQLDTDTTRKLSLEFYDGRLDVFNNDAIGTQLASAELPPPDPKLVAELGVLSGATGNGNPTDASTTAKTVVGKAAVVTGTPVKAVLARVLVAASAPDGDGKQAGTGTEPKASPPPRPATGKPAKIN